MKTSQNKHITTFVIVAGGLLLLIAAALLTFGVRPKSDLPSMEKKAQTLIQEVGGSDKIHEEASRLRSSFTKDGPPGIRFLDDSELQGFPVLRSIGTAVRLYDGKIVRVRIGNHLDGFFMDIVDRQNSTNAVTTKSLQVAPGIFVHR